MSIYKGIASFFFFFFGMYVSTYISEKRCHRALKLRNNFNLFMIKKSTKFSFAFFWLNNIVAERNNFKFIVWCGNYFWPLKFRFYIFDQWGWFMPFCSDDFPGQYKRRCNALSLSLHSSSSRTDDINMKRVHSTMGHFSFRRLFIYHLFIPPRPTGPRNFRLNT